MSLDSFSGDNFESNIDAEEDSSDELNAWDFNWHISRNGYWETVDEKFYTDELPNEPPLMAVPEKLAADMEIIEDPEIVNQVAKYWFPKCEDEYEQVMKITFNDFSVWHEPLLPWEKDYTRARQHLVERYLPEIVKWKAIIECRDVSEALRELKESWEEDEPKWFSDIDKTELSNSARLWLNENASWLPHIDKVIETEEIDLELDEDDDWTDDW